MFKTYLRRYINIFWKVMEHCYQNGNYQRMKIFKLCKVVFEWLMKSSIQEHFHLKNNSVIVHFNYVWNFRVFSG
jgi:hypothetical protein